MENIKISVVMGIFNEHHEERLSAALQSVLDQDMEGIEVLLCDDGSDEETVQLLQELAKKDDRVHLLRQEHAGLGAALNLGIRQAKGKYIARMDADDISLQGRFHVQYEFLEAHSQYDWVAGCAAVFDDTGVWGHRRMVREPGKEDFFRYSPYIHPSVMFRKSVFEECGCYHTDEYTMRCEDYELFMRFHGMGKKGYNLEQELICYREDRDGYKKRKYSYRIRECFVRRQGFRSLGINRGIGRLYMLRPLAAGLCPPGLVRRLRGVLGNAAGGI